jgi:hypothetical protein
MYDLTTEQGVKKAMSDVSKVAVWGALVPGVGVLAPLAAALGIWSLKQIIGDRPRFSIQSPNTRIHRMRKRRAPLMGVVSANRVSSFK